jgi:hypothetical protein
MNTTHEVLGHATRSPHRKRRIEARTTCRSILFATLLSSFALGACTSTTIVEPSGTSTDGGTSASPKGAAGSDASAASETNETMATAPAAATGDPAQDDDGAAPVGSGQNEVVADAAPVALDCPPCWAEWVCFVPPGYNNSNFLAGTPQADGSCLLTPLYDGGDTVTIPLGCFSSASSNLPVPWSIGMSGVDVTVTFEIPSRGVVTCNQT